MNPKGCPCGYARRDDCPTCGPAWAEGTREAREALGLDIPSGNVRPRNRAERRALARLARRFPGLVLGVVLAGCGQVDTDEDCTDEARVSPCDVDRHGPEWCFLTRLCRQ